MDFANIRTIAALTREKNELQEQAERFARALQKQERFIRNGSTLRWRCGYCNGETAEGNRETLPRDIQHTDDCVWIEAFKATEEKANL